MPVRVGRIHRHVGRRGEKFIRALRRGINPRWLDTKTIYPPKQGKRRAEFSSAEEGKWSSIRGASGLARE